MSPLGRLRSDTLIVVDREQVAGVVSWSAALVAMVLTPHDASRSHA
jgi:hypothetical protein